jgi:glycosyltransferase involved in cell wall biosynthesis
MRIAIVDPSSYTPPYDDRLSSALAKRGHDVELLTSPSFFGRPPSSDGYRRNEVFFTATGRLVRRSPRSRLRFVLKGAEYLPSLRRFRRRVAELDPDVVHVQWLPYPRYDLRWFRSLQRDRPAIFTAHDVLPRRTAHQRELWLEIFRIADRVVVHSQTASTELTAFGVDPARLAVIPHPLFVPAAAGDPEPPRGRMLLFFGLIRPEKGLDVLLRALPSIPDTRLVVAGDPVEPIEPYRDLAASLGIADRIEWRLRFIEESEIAELMASATAVVLPYRRIESSGVLATALGHGRPVVVTDVGSIGDTVREFGAGLVVPPDDPAALAAACAELLDDASAAFRGVLAARKLTWDKAAEAHERVYEEAIRR